MPVPLHMVMRAVAVECAWDEFRRNPVYSFCKAGNHPCRPPNHAILPVIHPYSGAVPMDMPQLYPAVFTGRPYIPRLPLNHRTGTPPSVNHGRRYHPRFPPGEPHRNVWRPVPHGGAAPVILPEMKHHVIDSASCQPVHIIFQIFGT